MGAFSQSCKNAWGHSKRDNAAREWFTLHLTIFLRCMLIYPNCWRVWRPPDLPWLYLHNSNRTAISVMPTFGATVGNLFTSECKSLSPMVSIYLSSCNRTRLILSVMSMRKGRVTKTTSSIPFLALPIQWLLLKIEYRVHVLKGALWQHLSDMKMIQSYISEFEDMFKWEIRFTPLGSGWQTDHTYKNKAVYIMMTLRDSHRRSILRA